MAAPQLDAKGRSSEVVRGVRPLSVAGRGHPYSTLLARLGVAAATCLLTACAVGPDYHPPKAPTPDEWYALPQTGVRVESPDAPSLAAWWTSLNDPTLSALIERALAANLTVKQAVARVQEARARRGVAMSGFFPSINGS